MKSPSNERRNFLKTPYKPESSFISVSSPPRCPPMYRKFFSRMWVQWPSSMVIAGAIYEKVGI